MDTSGYDPETGRTFTRAEPHEITHEGCVWTDEQIRELVPHGVVEAPDGSGWITVRSQAEGERFYTRYLSPAQVAERVLRCEACHGTSDQVIHGAYVVPCDECEPLRTLLLKLAQERVEQHHAASHAGTKPNLCWCESCESARSVLKLAGEGVEP